KPSRRTASAEIGSKRGSAEIDAQLRELPVVAFQRIKGLARPQGRSKGIGRLCEVPELEKLCSHPRMQLVGNASGEARTLDQLLDIHQVLAAMWGNHSRRQLQLDETRHRQQCEAFAAQSDNRRIGEGDGLRFIVARERARAQNIDVYAMLGVEELASTGNTLFVAASQVPPLEFQKILLSHHQIDIDRNTPVAILIQSERANDGVRETFGFEKGRQLVEC
ncbi:MAG TPA: hypothetical protein VGP93_04410, partial [Polyangiaceae bacterium]|nr:hypothetical protein [Polyangiaceae bacterium]